MKNSIAMLTIEKLGSKGLTTHHFTSSAALGVFLSNALCVPDTNATLIDCDGNDLNQNQSAIEKHLNAGRTLFAETSNKEKYTAFMLPCTEVELSDVHKFALCDSMIIDDNLFVGYVESENPKLVKEYIRANDNYKDELLRNHGGEILVRVLTQELDEQFEITLAEMVNKKHDIKFIKNTIL